MRHCPINFGDCYECEYFDPSDGACEWSEEKESKADLKKKYRGE